MSFKNISQQLHQLLTELYPTSSTEQILATSETLLEIINENKITNLNENVITQSDAILITYPDHICDVAQNSPSPLAQLASFYRDQPLFRSVANILHILPFHPSTGYDGYAITDYDAVDGAKFGTWDDIAAFRTGDGNTKLSFDLVLNHCSSSHPLFVEAVNGGNEETRDLFAQKFSAADGKSPILKARDESSLFYTFQQQQHQRTTTLSATPNPFKNVWCTYHRELVDWNWSGNPKVLTFFVNNILETFSGKILTKNNNNNSDEQIRQQQQLFSGVRLDAFGYVWKENGHPCVNHPKLKSLLTLFRTCLSAAGFEGQNALILPSITNVSLKECLETCFGTFASKNSGSGDVSGQLSYHLPLPALLLHTLHAGDVSVLSRWLSQDLPKFVNNFSEESSGMLLNLSSTHDGIGLTWCKDIFSEEQRSTLVDELVERGGIFKTRKPLHDDNDNDDILTQVGTSSKASHAVPWEVCITTWSACRPKATSTNTDDLLHVKRFLAVQAVVVALKGIPAFYTGVLLAAENALSDVDYLMKVKYPNDPDSQTLHCAHRAINRGKFSKRQMDAELADPASLRHRVLGGIEGLMAARKSSAAFHPRGNSQQNVYSNKSNQVLVVVRSHGEDELVMCFINFGNECVYVDPVDEIFTKFLTPEQKRKFIVEGSGGIFTNLIAKAENHYHDLRFGLVFEPYEVLFLKSGLENVTSQHNNNIRHSLEFNARKALQHPNSKANFGDIIGETDLWKEASMVQIVTNTIEKARTLANLDCKYQYKVEDYESINAKIKNKNIRVTLLQHLQPMHKHIANLDSNNNKDNLGLCKCFTTDQWSMEDFVKFHVANDVNAKRNNNAIENMYHCSHVGDVSGIDSAIENDQVANRSFFSSSSMFNLEKCASPQQIVILASPFCRSIQTAVLLRKHLLNQQRDADDKNVDIKIKILDELRAIDNMHSHSRRLPLKVLRSIFEDQEMCIDFSDVADDFDNHYLESCNNKNTSSSHHLLRVESRIEMESRTQNAFDTIFDIVNNDHENNNYRFFLVSHFTFLMTAITPRNEMTMLHFDQQPTFRRNLPPNRRSAILETNPVSCKLLHDAIAHPRMLNKICVDLSLSREEIVGQSQRKETKQSEEDEPLLLLFLPKQSAQ